jgi:hypothetical protein
MNVLVQLKSAFSNNQVIKNVLLCLVVIIVMHLLYGVYRSRTILQEGARRRRRRRGGSSKTNNCSKKTLRKCNNRFKKNCKKLRKSNKRKWRRACTVKTMKNCLRQYKNGCDRKRRGSTAVVKPPADTPAQAPAKPVEPTPPAKPAEPVSTKIYGCTDKNAYNYDSNANTDDGSCSTFEQLKWIYNYPTGVPIKQVHHLIDNIFSAARALGDYFICGEEGGNIDLFVIIRTDLADLDGTSPIISNNIIDGTQIQCEEDVNLLMIKVEPFLKEGIIDVNTLNDVLKKEGIYINKPILNDIIDKRRDYYGLYPKKLLTQNLAKSFEFPDWVYSRYAYLYNYNCQGGGNLVEENLDTNITPKMCTTPNKNDLSIVKDAIKSSGLDIKHGDYFLQIFINPNPEYPDYWFTLYIWNDCDGGNFESFGTSTKNNEGKYVGIAHDVSILSSTQEENFDKILNLIVNDGYVDEGGNKITNMFNNGTPLVINNPIRLNGRDFPYLNMSKLPKYIRINDKIPHLIKDPIESNRNQNDPTAFPAVLDKMGGVVVDEYYSSGYSLVEVDDSVGGYKCDLTQVTIFDSLNGNTITKNAAANAAVKQGMGTYYFMVNKDNNLEFYIVTAVAGHAQHNKNRIMRRLYLLSFSEVFLDRTHQLAMAQGIRADANKGNIPVRATLNANERIPNLNLTNSGITFNISNKISLSAKTQEQKLSDDWKSLTWVDGGVPFD